MTYVHVMMTFMNLTFYTIQDERFHMQYKEVKRNNISTSNQSTLFLQMSTRLGDTIKNHKE